MNLKKLGGAAGILLLLGILIALNAIFQPLRLRKDVTEDQLYTLSDGTKLLLGELNRDVTLKLYFSKSNDRLPVPLKNFGSRVRDLLAEYKSRGGGWLVVEEFDPKPDSDEEEWARRYGLQGQPLDMFGAGSELFFGIVAVSGNREAVIPMLTPDTEPRLEYMLTRMISEVSRDKAAKIGLMSALPVQGAGAKNPYMMMGQPPPQPAWSIIGEIERQSEIQNLGMDVTEIPADIDTLLVIHPAGINEAALFAIDQFVLRGGRLFAFVDPMCIAAQENMPPEMQQYGMPPPQIASDLDTLVQAWGLKMTTGQLACDESAATMLNAGNGRAMRNAAWLSLRAPHMNQDEVATSSLGDMMLPFAAAFQGDGLESLEVTTLLHTANDGFLVSTYEAQMGQIRPPALKQQLALAVRLQGNFKTAFPDGKPAPENSDDEENPAASESEHLVESAKPGVVVLVGDVDMLTDRIAMQALNFFGQQIMQPRNNNFAFAMNLTEQMTGSEALIGLRSRGSFDRPFDRVLDLEKQAQIKWQAEEQRLNENLQQTQMRLNQLQQARDDGQQLIMTPEQAAEIKKFREEVFQTQQSLKEVRKNLRSDIEQLGTRLKFINIAGVPLLVALFGIFYGLKLRKR
ncbi:MAG: Gldg family protein [Kiritimatiellales bacterium]